MSRIIVFSACLIYTLLLFLVYSPRDQAALSKLAEAEARVKLAQLSDQPVSNGTLSDLVAAVNTMRKEDRRRAIAKHLGDLTLLLALFAVWALGAVQLNRERQKSSEKKPECDADAAAPRNLAPAVL